MRVVPAGTYRRMPWKNGGGETIEIAASPEGASLDAFDWRVSMARVDRPGPFSVFPGVDRTLTVLGGGRLVLHFEDGADVGLTPDSAPYAFPADVPVTATLPEGGITDLNVMTRRGRMSHEVRRHNVESPTALACEADEALILLRGGAAHVKAATSELDLADGDAVILGAGGSITVTPAGTATLFVVAFSLDELPPRAPPRPESLP
jgi:environmental stress-induced protein Ves